MARPDPATKPEVDVWQRTSMAAERTWLAWWRTALTATAGALAVGRFAPELLDMAPWPYGLLGCRVRGAGPRPAGGGLHTGGCCSWR